MEAIINYKLFVSTSVTVYLKQILFLSKLLLKPIKRTMKFALLKKTPNNLTIHIKTHFAENHSTYI